MNYRVKQFFWAITSPLKSIDTKYIEKYLTKEEEEIFHKLSHADKHHCIRVCKDAIDMVKKENMTVDINKLARVALLHDVGKIEYPLNAVDKSVMVILNKISNGNLKKYNKYKKIDAYYNHPNKGIKVLNSIKKYDEEFLEVVEKHHYNHVGNNIYLKIIKECDDNN